MIKSLESVLRHLSDFHPVLQFLAIAVSVAVSEEFAALGVFALARHGAISWWMAGSATFVGAWAAQTVFWLAGRMAGRRALSWRVFGGLRESGRLESIHHHVVREGWIAILVMRFVPGTRIPVCLGAGILGMDALEFLGVLALATVAWMATLAFFAQGFVDAVGGRPLPLLVALVLAVPLFFGVRWLLRRRAAKRRA